MIYSKFWKEKKVKQEFSNSSIFSPELSFYLQIHCLNNIGLVTFIRNPGTSWKALAPRGSIKPATQKPVGKLVVVGTPSNHNPLLQYSVIQLGANPQFQDSLVGVVNSTYRVWNSTRLLTTASPPSPEQSKWIYNPIFQLFPEEGWRAVLNFQCSNFARWYLRD